MEMDFVKSALGLNWHLLNLVLGMLAAMAIGSFLYLAIIKRSNYLNLITITGSVALTYLLFVGRIIFPSQSNDFKVVITALSHIFCVGFLLSILFVIIRGLFSKKQ